MVVEKEQDGSVVIDTEPMSIHKYHRYANTTGLNEIDKEKYNTILDEIYKNPDDVDRLNDIQREIDNLKKDPANKGVVQYLQNQQRALIALRMRSRGPLMLTKAQLIMELSRKGLSCKFFLASRRSIYSGN